MKVNSKNVIVVGDRVLVKPVNLETRTKMGLYLPATVTAKEEVLSGIVVEIGPGLPLADPASDGAEPWNDSSKDAHYMPLQAQEGDFALFLKRTAIEIKLENEKYFVVPHAGLLLLLRDEETPIPKIKPDDMLI